MSFSLLVYNGQSIQASVAPQANQVPITGNDGSLTLNAPLNIGGPATVNSLFGGVVTFAIAGTISNTAVFVRADATTAAFALTLPPAATCTGQFLTVKKIDSSAHLVTVKGAGTENIDAANTYTGLSAQYNAVRLYSNGLGWDIV